MDSRANPWKTVSSRIAYQNPWVRVREDQVIRPDGQPGIYGVIEMPVATGVVALTPDRRIYLVGQYRYPTEHYSWEIIEGAAGWTEAPLTAAQRELQEEAGLIAARWQPLGGAIHLSNCVSAERAELFLAEELSETEATPEGTEVLQLQKVPLEQAAEMVATGEITDAMSIIGILRACKIR